MEKLTLDQRSSLIVEMLMQENPDRKKVFSLYQQLLQEKALLLEAIVEGDNSVRQTVWPQLDECKKDIQFTEDYINLLTNQQEN
jgi:hypothetical protein